MVKALLNHSLRDPSNGLSDDSAWRLLKPFQGVSKARDTRYTDEEVHRLIDGAPLGADLATVWDAPTTAPRDRKDGHRRFSNLPGSGFAAVHTAIPDRRRARADQQRLVSGARRDIDARLVAQHTDAAARPLHLGARTDRDRHPVALGIRQVFANVVGRSELIGEPRTAGDAYPRINGDEIAKLAKDLGGHAVETEKIGEQQRDDRKTNGRARRNLRLPVMPPRQDED
jgi:hypothetical protein